MPSFAVFVFLLGLSVASCVNFTTVYEWGELELDYAWPTEASRNASLLNESFIADHVKPRFMALYKERIFLSLENWSGVPVTLVSLPTSTASSAPPKLAPFPNWQYHDKSLCNNIHFARGIEVDRNGHLWVVDAGEERCERKLLIFDLDDGDKTILVHQFSSAVSEDVWDIVIDQTPDDEQFAYIAEGAEHLIVFSRDQNKSWTIDTPGHRFSFLALSPQEATRGLYLCAYGRTELYEAPVSGLRSGSRTAALNFVGKWEEEPYSMLADSANILYAAFSNRNYLSSWNASGPFSEKSFYQTRSSWTDMIPFTFALDATGTLWLTERYQATWNVNIPRHNLLRAAVGAGSYLHSASAVSGVPPTTPSPDVKSREPAGVVAEKSPASGAVSINILICLVQPCNFAAGAEPGQVQVSANQELIVKNKNVKITVP